MIVHSRSCLHHRVTPSIPQDSHIQRTHQTHPFVISPALPVPVGCLRGEHRQEVGTARVRLRRRRRPRVGLRDALLRRHEASLPWLRRRLLRLLRRVTVLRLRRVRRISVLRLRRLRRVLRRGRDAWRPCPEVGRRNSRWRSLGRPLWRSLGRPLSCAAAATATTNTEH